MYAGGRQSDFWTHSQFRRRPLLCDFACKSPSLIHHANDHLLIDSFCHQQRCCRASSSSGTYLSLRWRLYRPCYCCYSSCCLRRSSCAPDYCFDHICTWWWCNVENKRFLLYLLSLVNEMLKYYEILGKANAIWLTWGRVKIQFFSWVMSTAMHCEPSTHWLCYILSFSLAWLLSTSCANKMF